MSLATEEQAPPRLDGSTLCIYSKEEVDHATSLCTVISVVTCYLSQECCSFMTLIFYATSRCLESLGKAKLQRPLQLWAKEQEIKCLHGELSVVAAMKAFLDYELSVAIDRIFDLECSNEELK